MEPKKHSKKLFKPGKILVDPLAKSNWAQKRCSNYLGSLNSYHYEKRPEIRCNEFTRDDPKKIFDLG